MRVTPVSFAATCCILLAAAAACGNENVNTPPSSMAEYEQRLENLRDGSNIAAITAVIAKDQRIVWSKGFGTADIATQRAAADTTTYHLASLTKPFASTVLLQLVEEGKVSLDDPASKYGVNLSNPAIKVRHLLSMTSEGTPGTQFSYNGDRFALLETVIASAAGKSFAAALEERIIDRLGLNRTAPNPQSGAFSVSGLNKTTFEANMARGYTYTNRAYSATSYPTSFGAAAGLTSSALDVAAFSMAMDRDGTANSSLIVKVPDRGLTFVVLANTDGLSSAYPLGSGKLDSSPWAREFLDTFVIGSLALP
ncbi:MAG TPA: serine hydrolase domain-containing protein [Gemmatimonadaceae bacterium]|nr:serine hydrolase domain-containing protein [Gemmatimonadaceae bacterium]